VSSRREFITLLGGASVAWPVAARAQRFGALLTVGILNSVSPATLEEMLAGFRRGLSEVGFDENRNVKFAYRWAEGHYERLPALAADLIAYRPAVIFATGDAAWPAKEATTTIPIVFATGVDPIETRLVASLGNPGGNVTGVSWSSNALVPKRLELLRDLVPHVSAIGMLVNTKNPSAEIDIRALQPAAAALKLTLKVHGASTGEEIAGAFARMTRQKVEAVIIGADSFFVNQRRDIVGLEARYALPGSHSIREYVVDGG
jgi:ABC-type uncharacterized transport system substrate-binding protein